MVHGYGGSSTLFFQQIKSLSENHKVVLFDIIGMGASGRPSDFNYQGMSAEQVVDYFVQYFERWRDALKLEKFFLVGHSLGGYLSGLYTVKYPERV